MRKLSLFPTLFTFAALILTVPALADFQTGLDAYKKGDYVGAAKEWRPLAEDGSAAAQLNIGLLYLDGHGVPLDYGEAAMWLRRSAEQDNTEAQHELGALYGSGKGVKRDYVQAYKWMNICAAKGNGGCIAQRDLIAKKLKAAQLADGQRLATEFKPQKEAQKQ
jgi:TPR repeat protein